MAMSSDPCPSLPGALADRLTPERVLGRGSFGTVVLARDAAGSPVAVKLIPPEILDAPTLRARFAREVRAGQGLDSEHVVGLREGGLVGGAGYLVLEYIAGQPLDEVLAARGRLPPKEADRILEQALQGVEDLHAAGLVHRDLKPANLLVEDGGRVLLADLGLVRGVGEETLTRTGQLLGTPLYMPPEQMRGERVGPGGDLYSLGAIYFELLAGRPPFDGESLGAILAAKDAGLAAGLRAERVEVPAALDTLLRAWLHPDPGKRPPDASALREAWEAARHAAAPTADGTALAPGPGRDEARETMEVRAPRVAVTVAPESDPAPAQSRSRSRPIALVALLGLGLAGFMARGTMVEGPAPLGTLSPAGRRALEDLRAGASAPVIDDAVHLAGTDRTAAVEATWKAGLEAFDELLRSQAARALAAELPEVRLMPEEAEALGKVLFRRRLLAHYLDARGAFEHRPSELAARLEQAYQRVLRVERLPALDFQTVGEDDERDLDEVWTWSVQGAARRAEERAVVDALGGRWVLVRRWEKDFQRYEFDHPTNIRPRLCKQALSGARFVDPSEGVPSLLQLARRSYHQALRDHDPSRLEIGVQDLRGRPLVLAGTTTRWNPTIQGRLTLIGEEERLELPFSIPPPGQGADPDPGHELHQGFLLRVAPEVLPLRLRALWVQAFGLQPIGTIDQVVQLCEVYQQVEGELPELLREPPRE